MTVWGVTALTHDASISVIQNDKILFAGEAERFSKKKFDHELNQAIIDQALKSGKPELIAFYEHTWLKKLRQFRHGHFRYAFDVNKFPRRYLKRFGLDVPVIYVPHHLSHASAGFYTSPFEEATVVVIDALGEFQTMTIWHGRGTKLELKFEVNFPHSLGLLYSAFTKRCGLKPSDEEYILMGMAAYGEPLYVNRILGEFFEDVDEHGLCRLTKSVHEGIPDWLPEGKAEDLAASIQVVTTMAVLSFMRKALRLTGCTNLVYMGGVALNCCINSDLPQAGFKDIWIMPNPGDAGSSLGAAAYAAGRRLSWTGPYLGYNLNYEYPVQRACELLRREPYMVGVANGRAEFGPRALGNRSLLADPRLSTAKDSVNEIKRRQKFRPFAPAIMEEYAEEYFDMPVSQSPYMQFVSKCRKPDEFPAVCHVDGTSRVQTVSQKDHPGFHALLKEFHRETGCPMLLNTSLNIRGKPMVNNDMDAANFEHAYNVKVV